MLNERTHKAVLDEIAEHPRGEELARLVHAVAFAAADERRTHLSEGVAEAAERAGITSKDADTSAGNVLTALERSGTDAAPAGSAVLLSALLARGVALSPPAGTDAEARVAEALVWIASNTSIDALPALDLALGQNAGGLWLAVGDLIRRADAAAPASLGRAAAIVAAAALGASSSSIARGEAKVLAGELRDPLIRSLLTPGGGASGLAPSSGEALSAEGEIAPTPHGPVAFLLLAVTGVLVVLRLARLFGRWVLRYRRPAEIRISPRGVTVLSKTEILGRTLREREMHIPVESILRATREVRYPRLAMYAGLFALAAGSYLGLSLFVDGARAGSPELLGMGALVVALGVALDFALVNVAGSAHGRCRLVFVPRKGAAFAMERIDPAAADAALGRLVQRA